MTHDPAEGYQSKVATVFILICFAALLYFLYQVFAPFISVLIWAAVLTVVFSPLHGWVLARLRGRHAIASFVTCMLILILIVLPMLVLGYLVTQQSIAVYQNIRDNPDSLTQVNERLGELQKRPSVQRILNLAEKWFGIREVNLQQYYRDALSSVSGFLLERGPAFIRDVSAVALNFLLMFITMYFLFRDGPRLLAFIRSASPLPEAFESEVIKKFQDVSYATLFGSLLSAAAHGASATILFLSLGLPAPLFWGAIVALASLVPVIGAGLVWIPWGTFLLISGQTAKAVILLVVGLLIISSLDNVLKPMVIKGRTDMHPLLVFLSVLGGLEAFGFLGLLLGPLIVALFVSFLNFYRYQSRKTVPGNNPPPPEEHPA